MNMLMEMAQYNPTLFRNILQRLPPILMNEMESDAALKLLASATSLRELELNMGGCKLAHDERTRLERQLTEACRTGLRILTLSVRKRNLMAFREAALSPFDALEE